MTSAEKNPKLSQRSLFFTTKKDLFPLMCGCVFGQRSKNSNATAATTPVIATPSKRRIQPSTHRQQQPTMRSTVLRLLPLTAFLSLPVATCFLLAPPSSLAQASSSNSCLDTSTSTTTPLKSTSNSDTSAASTMKFFQHEISITAPSRGCHLITGEIQKTISKDLSQIKIGMCNLFVQHTSASLTINENADPDVRRDMEVALNKIVPAEWNRDGTFLHTMEGDDDMPGHVKSSLMGTSINIPIRNGRLALGTWQGVYLNEHRDQGGWGGGHTRKIIITLQGQA